MTDSNNDRLTRMKQRLLETEILAQMPDLVNAHATEFVANLMRGWYQITDNGEFEPTDQVPLRTRDFQPTPVAEISDYLHSEHAYLFRQSAPAGVSNAVTKEAPPPALNRAEMTVAERSAFIRKYGQKEYLSLPENPTAAKPLAERRRSEMSTEEKARIIRERGAALYEAIPI